MDKKSWYYYIKTFSFEIVTVIVGVILYIVLVLNQNVSEGLITNFWLFRPDSTFIIMFFFTILFIGLLIALIVLGRKKKLKSNKTEFDKTVVLTNAARKMSQTQAAVTTQGSRTIGMMKEQIIMPKDITSDIPGIVEFYFTYEEKLNM